MYPPVDYPKNDSSAATDKKEDISLATLREKTAVDTITTDMIQSAQLRIEAAHQLPDVNRPTVVSAPSDQVVSEK